jgi:hypothetical protein
VVLVEGELFSSCFQLITKNERWNMCNCRLYLFLTVNLACSIKKPASIAIILNWFVHVELWCASLNWLQKMLHWIVTPRQILFAHNRCYSSTKLESLPRFCPEFCSFCLFWFTFVLVHICASWSFSLYPTVTLRS